jgi:hypothetical protein
VAFCELDPSLRDNAQFPAPRIACARLPGPLVIVLPRSSLLQSGAIRRPAALDLNDIYDEEQLPPKIRASEVDNFIAPAVDYSFHHVE